MFDVVDLADLRAWTTAFFAGHESTRERLLRSPPASTAFVRLAIFAKDGKIKAKALAERVLAHGNTAPGWRELLEGGGASVIGPVCEAQALVMAGVPESELDIPDELSRNAFLHPERLPELLKCEASVRALLHGLVDSASPALHWAAAGNHVDAVKSLLKIGVDPVRLMPTPLASFATGRGW